MTTDEYNYLCSLRSTVNSWLDYQKQQIACNNSFYNTAFNNQQPYNCLHLHLHKLQHQHPNCLHLQHHKVTRNITSSSSI